MFWFYFIHSAEKTKLDSSGGVSDNTVQILMLLQTTLLSFIKMSFLWCLHLGMCIMSSYFLPPLSVAV